MSTKSDGDVIIPTLFFKKARGILKSPLSVHSGEGSKGRIYLVSITKSFSKILITNFVCVLTNERYKTYQTGFSFYRLGHAPGGTLVCWGCPMESKGQISLNFGYHVNFKIFIPNVVCILTNKR